MARDGMRTVAGAAQAEDAAARLAAAGSFPVSRLSFTTQRAKGAHALKAPVRGGGMYHVLACARVRERGFCGRYLSSMGGAQAYRSVGLRAGEMGIQHTVVSGFEDVGRWGTMLHTTDAVAVQGDSGSPWMSPKGRQIGVHVGGIGEQLYAFATCKYADAIAQQARALDAVVKA
jgi:hypothetical protein